MRCRIKIRLAVHTVYVILNSRDMAQQTVCASEIGGPHFEFAAVFPRAEMAGSDGRRGDNDKKKRGKAEGDESPW